MREIKFRVWDKQKKRWIENTGNPYVFPFNGKVAMTCWGSKTGYISDTDYSEYYELSQYTGLKDKNEKEIYEGDIISVVDIGTNPSENSRHQIVYCGEDDYPAFDLKPHLDCDSNGLSYLKAGGDEEMIVIGNVYENPELLKEK